MYGDPREEPVTHRFRFTGTGTEYFQVWIVNVLLTMLTLGIYSAWAKVRNKQYFYGNTRLDDASFEYTANPVSILKGRLIVVAFFVVYSVTVGFVPITEPAFVIAILFLVPWAIVRALSFNLRYSAYRNLRFRFTGRYGPAFVIYILGPAAALLTGGLLWPLIVFARKRFLVENSRYGDTGFTFDATPGRFFVIYLIAAGVALGIGIAAGLAMWLGGAFEGPMSLGAPSDDVEDGEQIPEHLAALGVALFVVYVLMISFVGVYIQVATTNYQWRSTRLRENRFDLQLRYLPMLWIQFSNFALIVLTIGLFIPFAKVRIARYRIERLSLETTESLDAFIAGAREKESALGDEFGEALDLDLGL